VLTVEDHRLPRVSVSIWYHVGPVNEEPGPSVFANVLDNIFLHKTKQVPEDA
jgi:zinc protease